MKDIVTEIKKGDKCTVSHHYGHTDTEKAMKIQDIQPNDRCKSGIEVKVSGLKWTVDSGLINIIKKIKK